MYVVNDGYTLWDFATTPPRFPHHTLRYDRYEVHVPEEIRRRAALSVERMIAIG
jgi:quinolinate synthase